MGSLGSLTDAAATAFPITLEEDWHFPRVVSCPDEESDLPRMSVPFLSANEGA